jgi:hypothetical protein
VTSELSEQRWEKNLIGKQWRMRRREFIVAFLALSVLGCTSSQAPAPPPTKLEVTIPGTSTDKIKTTLVSEMQKRKFRIVNETQSEMSFEQLAGSEVLKSLPETDIGKAPIERVTYTIKPIAGDIRVSSEIALISKAGSPQEKKIDISQSAEAQTVQSVLDKIVGK